MEGVSRTRRCGLKEHERSGAKSKSNCLCSELVCGRKRELFRRPLLRHCCSKHKYVRFPGQILRNTADFLAESYDTSASTKLRAKARRYAGQHYDRLEAQSRARGRADADHTASQIGHVARYHETMEKANYMGVFLAFDCMGLALQALHGTRSDEILRVRSSTCPGHGVFVSKMEESIEAHDQASLKTAKDPDGGPYPVYPSGKS